jgi:hypothetical protein
MKSHLADAPTWAETPRWSPTTTLLALAASVPPLATIWFERRATRTGGLVRGPALPAA